MAIPPLAFGPLSRQSYAANQILSGQGVPSGLSRLSGLSLGSGTEPPAAGIAPGPRQAGSDVGAPVEEFVPLFPQEDTGGGDLSNLPGFQAATGAGGVAELPSAPDLTPSVQNMVSETRNALTRLFGQAREGGPLQMPSQAFGDLNVARSGVSGARDITRLASQALGGGASLFLPPALSGLGANAAATGFAPLTTKGLNLALESAGQGGSQVGSALGQAVPYLGLLASLAGLAGSAQSQNPLGLASGTLGAYSSLSALSGGALPSLGSLASSALSSLGLGTIGGAGGGLAGGAAGLGAGVSSGAATGVGTTAGAAATSIPAGLTAGIVALPMLAAVGMNIADQLATAENQMAAARRAQRLATSIPGAFQDLAGAAQVAQGLGPEMTPEQALAALNQLNRAVDTLKGSGLYSFLEHGGTSVEGNTGMPGDVKFGQGPAVLQQMAPYLQLLRLGQIRAADVLGRAGQPVPGYGFPAADDAARLGSGGWFDPLTLAQSIGGAPFQQALMPYGGTNEAPEGLYRISEGLYGAPGSQAIGMASTLPFADRARVMLQQTPYGLVSKPLYDQLNALRPGNLEQGLVNLLQAYGGVIEPYASRFVAPSAPAPERVYQVAALPRLAQASAADLAAARRYQDFTSGGM